VRRVPIQRRPRKRRRRRLVIGVQLVLVEA